MKTYRVKVFYFIKASNDQEAETLVNDKITTDLNGFEGVVVRKGSAKLVQEKENKDGNKSHVG